MYTIENSEIELFIMISEQTKRKHSIVNIENLPECAHTSREELLIEKCKHPIIINHRTFRILIKQEQCCV